MKSLLLICAFLLGMFSCTAQDQTQNTVTDTGPVVTTSTTNPVSNTNSTQTPSAEEIAMAAIEDKLKLLTGQLADKQKEIDAANEELIKAQAALDASNKAKADADSEAELKLQVATDQKNIISTSSDPKGRIVELISDGDHFAVRKLETTFEQRGLSKDAAETLFAQKADCSQN